MKRGELTVAVIVLLWCVFYIITLRACEKAIERAIGCIAASTGCQRHVQMGKATGQGTAMTPTATI